MPDETCFSTKYTVRRLTEQDVPDIFRLCVTNPAYYEYCGAQAAPQDILRDLSVLPPGTAKGQKYYVGFFDAGCLIAVLDLIDGYPTEQAAWIGFFMVHGARSGQGLGSSIMDELAAYLSATGIQKVGLAYELSNPQASHFWKKNCFVPVREVEHKYGHMAVAERFI